jgi:hypothetical protein
MTVLIVASQDDATRRHMRPRHNSVLGSGKRSNEIASHDAARYVDEVCTTAQQSPVELIEVLYDALVA